MFLCKFYLNYLKFIRLQVNRTAIIKTAIAIYRPVNKFEVTTDKTLLNHPSEKIFKCFDLRYL